MKGGRRKGGGAGTYFAVHEKTGHSDSSQLFSSHTVLALRSGGVLLSKYVCDCVQLFWALSFPMGTVAPTQWEGIQNISTGL